MVHFGAVQRESSNALADADQGVMDVMEAWPLVWVVLPTAQHEFVNRPWGVFRGW